MTIDGVVAAMVSAGTVEEENTEKLPGDETFDESPANASRPKNDAEFSFLVPNVAEPLRFFNGVNTVNVSVSGEQAFISFKDASDGLGVSVAKTLEAAVDGVVSVIVFELELKVPKESLKNMEKGAIIHFPGLP